MAEIVGRGRREAGDNRIDQQAESDLATPKK